MKEVSGKTCPVCRQSSSVYEITVDVLSVVTATYDGHQKYGHPGELTITNGWKSLNEILAKKVFRDDCVIDPAVVTMELMAESMIKDSDRKINAFEMHPDTWNVVMKGYEKISILSDRVFSDESEMILVPQLDEDAKAKFKLRKRLFACGKPVVLSKKVKRGKIEPVYRKIKRKGLPGKSMTNIYVDGLDPRGGLGMEGCLGNIKKAIDRENREVQRDDEPDFFDYLPGCGPE